jgi:cation diffusion facilitator family transporter
MSYDAVSKSLCETHKKPGESEMDEKSVLFGKGEKAAKFSTYVLVILSVLKGTVAVFSGSVALLAGTIDSFSDIFSSIAVWAGLKIAKKKPTERFPYGYYKAETFALLVVSLIIVVSSAFIMLESFQKFFEVAVISFPELALAAAALSAIVYYLLAKYKEKIGHQIGSQALISEGLHSMVDVYTSALVFVGVFLGSYGYHSVEALIGLSISVYVLVRGLLFGKDAALILMDVSPSPQRTKEIKEIAESVQGVRGTHEIRLRKSGPVFFGEMHVELQETLSLEKAHAISEEIETSIKKRFADMEIITVHVGLAHREKTKIAIPILEDRGLDSLVSLHFGSAPHFAFVEVEKGQIMGFYVAGNEAAKLKQKKGIATAHFLIKEKSEVVLAGGIGEGPFHVLRDKLVQLYYLPKTVGIREAIRLLNEKSLEKMISPIERHEGTDTE